MALFGVEMALFEIKMALSGVKMALEMSLCMSLAFRKLCSREWERLTRVDSGEWRAGRPSDWLGAGSNHLIGFTCHFCHFCHNCPDPKLSEGRPSFGNCSCHFCPASAITATSAISAPSCLQDARTRVLASRIARWRRGVSRDLAWGEGVGSDLKSLQTAGYLHVIPSAERNPISRSPDNSAPSPIPNHPTPLIHTVAKNEQHPHDPTNNLAS